MIEQWQAMADDGREFESWDEITRHAEDLPEDEVRALIEDLAGWSGRRPMPYRWWERRSRGEWAPCFLLADHRVLYGDFEMREMEDPDAYEEFYGTSAVGDEGFLSGFNAIGTGPDLRWTALVSEAEGNSSSGGLEVFDAETGAWETDGVQEDDHYIGWGEDVAVSPDGSLLATAGRFDRQVIVWRVPGPERLWAAGSWRTGAEGAGYSHIGFSGDGRLIVAVSSASPWDGTVERNVVVAGAETGDVMFTTATVVAGGAVLDHSGSRLAFVGPDGDVLIHRLPDGEVVARHRTALPGAGALALSPEGDTVAVGGDGGVELLGRSTGRVPAEGTCQAITWSPDGPRALFTSEEAATVIDGQGRALWTRPMEDPSLLVAAFTPGGHTLVTIETYPAEITAWFLDRDLRG
ncbi:WD40 repeat domain-containing protein [Actinoallomurus sp. CA-150999]|uniref:WD40 repeat domain-containing protein n=1 Tax=Actinoallomurus sp. CA-150999 TaxID=3239887 RepID=UPI003D918DE8